MIDASDSPSWNEDLELYVLLSPCTLTLCCSSIGDTKWKVRLTLKDSSGNSLGFIELTPSDVDIGSKDPAWFNMEDPSPSVRTSARIAVTVHQTSESMYGQFVGVGISPVAQTEGIVDLQEES